MNEKLTREQRDWIVAEAAANFRHHGVFRLKLFEETLNAHTEPEDEPKLITDEMEADILGMFHRETPKEMHARLEKELGHKISFEQEDSDEHVFCPTCKAEVYWVKGWYDCDYCGQLKEHPLMDTAEDECICNLDPDDTCPVKIFNEDCPIHGYEYEEVDGWVICPDCGREIHLPFPDENQITLRKWKEYEHWLGEWNGDEPAPQEHITFEDWLQEASDE